MDQLNLGFAPLIPIWILVPLALVGLVLVAVGVLHKLKSAWWRGVGLIALILALSNPVLHIEDREPVKTVVALVVDQSSSQQVAGRPKQTLAAQNALIEKIQAHPQFELRQAVVSDQIESDSGVSSAVFRALKETLQDVPPARIGGAIIISDGQIHDIPQTSNQLGFNAPVHALITGKKKEFDRYIELTTAPKFGIVGKEITLEYKVHEKGFSSTQPIVVTVLLNGKIMAKHNVYGGQGRKFKLTIPHGGKSVIELNAASAPNELTTVNNRVFSTVHGIRENLRVLLISGEPYAGERTWRNLLKSDPAVDLVHFTILRPPEKQDGTPIHQLSLIAFPTRELFIQKIDEFDLIIFDRYKRRGVLPLLYFDNIARYVEEGGAILIAAGPEIAGIGSIAQTPLERVLPAMPNGDVLEQPFIAKISDTGHKHPITRGLRHNNKASGFWGPWFRTISTDDDDVDPESNVILTGPDDQPLLLVSHAGEGRIAQLMSDQVWLWARGFEGGGPYVPLLRRLAHWLMKEPDLDEDQLNANAQAGKLRITRQSLSDKVSDVTVTTPTGKTKTVKLQETEPGKFEAEIEAKNIGLYQVQGDDKTALSHLGPTNPKEYSHIISTTRLIEPIISQTGGRISRLERQKVPAILPVRDNAAKAGNGWIGLKDTQSTILKSVSSWPIFSEFIGLGILLFMITLIWVREGYRRAAR